MAVSRLPESRAGKPAKQLFLKAYPIGYLHVADSPTAHYMTHMFDMRRRETGVECQLTKVNLDQTPR